LFRGSGGSLAPRLLQPGAGEPSFELYNLQTDRQEATNVYDQHPELVECLKATATKIVLEGRSTPGQPQKNDGPQLWPELTWIPEAASLARPKAEKAGAKSKAKQARP
jgi:hypothetical protein